MSRHDAAYAATERLDTLESATWRHGLHRGSESLFGEFNKFDDETRSYSLKATCEIGNDVHEISNLPCANPTPTGCARLIVLSAGKLVPPGKTLHRDVKSDAAGPISKCIRARVTNSVPKLYDVLFKPKLSFKRCCVKLSTGRYRAWRMKVFRQLKKPLRTLAYSREIQSMIST
ncbi:hypothetical protein WAI453_007291 [Rhynchosporium graminicola]